MAVRMSMACVALTVLCVAVACSKSSTTQASFESSSDSSSSPFKSSSHSSGGDDDKAVESAYQRDVRDSTASFAASGEDVESFQRNLSAIAESHGMTDWEQADATYLAIGRGLASAEPDEQRYRELAIALSDQDFRKLDLVRAGYEADPSR